MPHFVIGTARLPGGVGPGRDVRQRPQGSSRGAKNDTADTNNNRKHYDNHNNRNDCHNPDFLGFSRIKKTYLFRGSWGGQVFVHLFVY